MKELSIEQKAKAYDEALERAKSKVKNDKDHVLYEDDILDIFPELTEPEDERIKKLCKVLVRTCLMNELCTQEDNDDCIAWLEKQGTSYTKKDVDNAYLEGVTNTKNEIEKQYEANYQIRKDIATFIFNYKGDIKDRAKWIDYLGIKVSFVEKQGEHKPAKFKVGDWVVFNNNRHKNSIYRIEKIENYQYILRHILGGSMPLPYSSEDMLRLWTIDDAKNGDVLATDNGRPFIFNGLLDKLHPKSPVAYCGIDADDRFFVPKRISWWTDDEVKPASKEERELLFQKMKEAGYDFDFEKKELKKIGQNDSQPDDLIEESYQYQADDLINMVTEKPAWSEEDEKMFKAISIVLTLKSAEVYLKSWYITPEEADTWFKSIKERYIWKPSDEQVKVCKEVYADLLSAKGFDINTVNGELNRLEEQLRNNG